MKRTLTSIAAAGVVLGSFVPAALAATTSHSVLVAKPSYNQRTVNIGSYTAGVKGIAAKDGSVTTEFLPVYYLQKGLASMNYKASWDGNNMILNITTPDGVTPNLDNPVIGTGDIAIQINGTMVQSAPHLVAKDPASGVNTTYVPVWYIEQVMKRLNFINSYDGHTWKEVANDFAISGNNSVGVGGKDTLSLTSKTQTVDASKVTWTVDGNGGAVVDANGNFVASAAGTYNVTATYEGVTSKATVVVYGQATAVKLAAATDTVVANGASTDVITATVVDANGNAVPNFNGTLTVSKTTDNSATLYTDASGNATAAAPALTVTNGVAKFTVISVANNFGRSDTYSVTGQFTQPNGTVTTLTAGTATVGSVAQTPTSIKVSPSTSVLANNSVNSDNVTAQVLDQAGEPMLSGVYQLTFNVSGPGTFAGGSTSAVSMGASYNGTDNAVEAQLPVSSVQGSAGTITVSVTGTNLTSGSATISSTAVGQEAKVALSASTTTGTVGSDYLPVTVTLEDSNGNPSAVPTGGSVRVNLDEATTAGALDFFSDSTHLSPITYVTFAPGQSTATVYVAPHNNAGAIAAGSYKMTAVDNASNLTAATSLPLTFNANSASTVSFATTTNQKIAAASPTATVTVQLKDAYGNVVKEAGDYVQVGVVAAGGNTGTATLNGKATYGTGNQPFVVQTDANGTATLTLAAQPYYNDSYQVEAQLNSSSAIDNTWAHGVDSASYQVANAIAGNLSVGFTTSSAANAPTTSVETSGGAPVYATVAVKDAYGNAVAGDALEITLNNGATITDSTGTVPVTPTSTTSTTNTYDLSAGQYGFYIEGGKAGAETVSIKDLSANGLAGSGTLSVVAGTASKVTAVNNSGAATGQSVTSTGVYGPYTVEVTDAGGNVVNATSATTLNLGQLQAIFGNGVTGVRTSTSGSETQSVTLAAGTATTQVYLDTTSNIGIDTALDLGNVPFSSTLVTSAPVVTAVAGSAGNKTVTASWATVAGAASYNVQTSIDGGANWSAVTNTTGLSSTFTGTAAGQSVEFKVTPVNAGGTAGAAGTSTAVATPAAVASTFTVTPATANVADGATQTVSATVLDQYGTAISGVTVNFALQTTPGGALSGATATTDASGVATVTYTAPATGTGTDTVTATVSGATSTASTSALTFA